MMQKRSVVRPRLKPQSGTPHSPQDALARRFKAGENTSIFYTHVQQTMFGGTVAPLNNGFSYLLFPWQEIRNFRPDIEHKRPCGPGYTEVKAVSTRTSQPHCSTTQFEDYSFMYLRELEQGRQFPFARYAMFRYGKHEFTGQHKLQNGELIHALAENTRDLIVMPFNLTTFVLLNSPARARDQTSCASSVNERTYWDIRSRTINTLHDHNPLNAAQIILDDNPQNYARATRKKIIEDLFIDRLIERKYESPQLVLGKKKRIKLKRFNISEFSLSPQDRVEWQKHLLENHRRILRRLGVRNLYDEATKYGDEVVVSQKPIKEEEELEEAPF